MLDKIKSLLLYPLPQHLLSRQIYWLTRTRFSSNSRIIRWFIRQFDVDMTQAEIQDLHRFNTFNDFFTRQLKASARPIADDGNSLACPADGKVSALGAIDGDHIIQAKNHDYSVQQLLGGDETEAACFSSGSFITIYLSPRDYHRIHMPASGTLRKMVHIPGRLFSVAPFTVNNVPSLFARNERVASFFDTPNGRLAVIMVGAMNVSAIETVWAGLVTPPAGKQISTVAYEGEQALSLACGDEMGRFNMGSTVIVLTENKVDWDPGLSTAAPVLMGSSLSKRQP